MSDNSDENEEEETLDLPSSSTTPLPSEDKNLTNLKTLAHLSPRITPDLDDPMAGKPRWKEFRFSFLMSLIARGLMDAFIRNGYDEDEVDAEDRVEGITIDNKLGDPSETGKCHAGERLPFHDVEFRCRQIWYHMLPSDNPWHQALIRSSGTVVAMVDELDKIYLTRDDVTATEAQQEWSSFRWKIGIDMAIFNREWLRLTSEHISHNGEMSPKAIYVQYKVAVTSQNKHCPADGDEFFDDVFDRWLSRIERRNAEIARKDLKILYGDVLTAYRRKVRSGKISRPKHHVFSTSSTPFDPAQNAYPAADGTYFSMPDDPPAQQHQHQHQHNNNNNNTNHSQSGKKKVSYEADLRQRDDTTPTPSAPKDADPTNGYGIKRSVWRKMSISQIGICASRNF